MNNKTKYEAYNSTNVVVDIAESSLSIGDILIFDKTDNKKKAIKWETFNSSKLDTDKYVVLNANYFGKDGASKACFVASVNAPGGSVMWANDDYYILSGIDYINGTTFKMSFYTTAAHTDVTVTIPENTQIANVAAIINDAANDGVYFTAVKLDNSDNIGIKIRGYNTTDMTNATWGNFRFRVTEVDGDTTVVKNTSTEIEVGGILTIIHKSPVSYQFEECKKVCPLIPTLGATVTRNDESNQYYAGCHFDKFKSYYSVNGSSNFEQDSSASIMNLSKFNSLASSTNPAEVILYEKYNKDYDTYLMGKMVKYPVARGAVSKNQANGLLFTNMLAAISTVDYNDNTIPAYPAAYNASQYGVTVSGHTTGCEAGNWALPTMEQICMLIPLCGLDSSHKSDFNDAQSKISGASLIYGSGQYYWTPAEYYAYSAFYYNGYDGILTDLIKYDAFSVRGVVALNFEA